MSDDAIILKMMTQAVKDTSNSAVCQIFNDKLESVIQEKKQQLAQQKIKIKDCSTNSILVPFQLKIQENCKESTNLSITASRLENMIKDECPIDELLEKNNTSTNITG